MKRKTIRMTLAAMALCIVAAGHASADIIIIRRPFSAPPSISFGATLSAEAGSQNHLEVGTFDAPTGSTVVCGFAWNGSATPNSVFDDVGGSPNTYTILTLQNGANEKAFLAYSHLVTGSSTITVGLALAGGSTSVIAGSCIVVNGPTTLDVEATGVDGINSGGITGPSISTSASNTAILSFCGFDRTTVFSNTATGFSIQTQGANNTGNLVGDIVSTTYSNTIDFSGTVNAWYACAAASFK